MPLRLKESIFNHHRLPRNDDLLMGRAELLSERDRDLIEATVIRGLSARSIARMTGMTTSHVRAHVHKLCKRMKSRRFLAAARAMPYLTPFDALLAKLRYCQALAHRRLCRELGISYHVLRRRLDLLAVRIEMISLLQRSETSALINERKPSRRA